MNSQITSLSIGVISLTASIVEANEDLRVAEKLCDNAKTRYEKALNDYQADLIYENLYGELPAKDVVIVSFTKKHPVLCNRYRRAQQAVKLATIALVALRDELACYNALTQVEAVRSSQDVAVANMAANMIAARTKPAKEYGSGNSDDILERAVEEELTPEYHTL